MNSLGKNYKLDVLNNVNVHGFELGFFHTDGSLNISISSDELLKMMRSNSSPFSKELLLRLEEFQALIFLKDFETSALFKDIESKKAIVNTVKRLTKITQCANFVLNSDQTNDKQKQNAHIFLNALDTLQVNWIPE